jgi:hypothetical protein
MAVTVAEDCTIGREERPPTRLWLAHRMKPARDRAVVRTLLRALGVAFAEAEVVAPVTAPIDVRFREANFHLREVFDRPCERDGQDQATRIHYHASVLADGENPRGPAAGKDLTEVVSHVTAAGGARRVVWRSVCRVDAPALSMSPGACLAHPHRRPRSRPVVAAGAQCRCCVHPTGWCCIQRAARRPFCAW